MPKNDRKSLPSVSGSPPEPLEGIDNFSAYQEYNKVLRTWFVAFGIGGPALLLTNATVAGCLEATGKLRRVALAFLFGAASQVVGALINKFANWYVYSGSLETSPTPTYRIACWLCEQFWVDMLLDLVTVGSFGYAIWTLLAVFGKPS